MPRTDHRRALARTLAARAAAEGWTPWILVSAIRTECDCTLLQAHRYSRGWALEDVRGRLADLGARVTVQQVSAWETGRSRPNDSNTDLLCRLYETRPDRLGYGHDYTPTDDDTSRPAPAVPTRTDPPPKLPPSAPSAPARSRHRYSPRSEGFAAA